MIYTDKKRGMNMVKSIVNKRTHLGGGGKT